MKKTGILVALMMLFVVSVSAQTNYSVKPSTGMVDANEHGTIIIPNDMQLCQKGKKVTFSCSPNGGYGLVRGAFYAVKNADGTYGETISARPESKYPEDRANTQEFSFIMPEGDVEVWAYFDTSRMLVNHKAPHGKLEPVYGRREHQPDSLVFNVPAHPIYLLSKPDKGYELVDAKIVNISAARYAKTADTITVWMPNEKETVHVTPVFGKQQYTVKTAESPSYIKVTYSNEAPKSREEVEVTLTSPKGYIPTNFDITGCDSWWSVGKPEQQKDGSWKTVYRFKVGLQDVTIHFNEQKVHSFTVNNTEKTNRVQTLIPHPFPDYPGVAAEGQQIPMVFMMPENFTVTYVAKNAENKDLPALVYHNELENSFAEMGMYDWKESDDYQGWGLPIKVDADTDGNKYWSTSVINSMSQEISISGRNFPKNAYKVTKIVNNDTIKRLNIAAIASINPRMARSAKIRIAASGTGFSDTLFVTDLKNKEAGWQTVFKTLDVPQNTKTLSYLVSSEGDDQNRKRNHDGPQFDDLCLLIPVTRDAIQNEDVLVFTMGSQDVTIDYTPTGEQNTVSVNQQEHATVTLRNVTTGEEGESVKAMDKDVIVIKGAYDEGYTIYEMDYREKDVSDDDADYLFPDSVDLAGNISYYHFIVTNQEDLFVNPKVDNLSLRVENNYGGDITLDKDYAKKGEKVVVTITPKAGSKLIKIRTVPAGIVTFKPENVDEKTGGGTYSFEMPTAYLTVIPEFSVPIATADEFANISGQNGEFYLTADIDLGNNWNNRYFNLWGDLDGKGHQITYGGPISLFETVSRTASVRHLHVKANVNGDQDYVGGITKINYGIIEDCEVTGTLKSTDNYSYVSGIAGRNMPDGPGAIISRCHVLCDAIEGSKVYGIAYQEAGGTVKNNVFNGKFVNKDNQAFMICNDASNSTVEDNYYVTNSGNARAITSLGMTAAKPADLVSLMKSLPDDSYPVFLASLRVMYDGGYLVNLGVTAGAVELVDRLSEKAPAGTEFSASVRVIGNNHLKSITITADGSDPQDCPFTDHEDNVYSFSFTMPARDVSVSFTTEAGRFIYTPQQFAAINDASGTFLLARDLDLNNWEQQVNLNGTLHGGGHTIRYHGDDHCVGLFNMIRSGAVLQDLRVIGLVETFENCGGIAYINEGTIRNCHFSGRITKLMPEVVTSKKKRKKGIVDRISALTCIMDPSPGKLDHCSATGILKCNFKQDAINQNPLCYQTDIDVSSCTWVDPTQSTNYQKQLTDAEAALKDYPVYAQGIIDKINPCVTTGATTLRAENGKTLDELTIVDGEPFSCTGDIKVKRIIYKRPAMTSLEQWVLPFEFDRIAGNGTFEYHKTIEENKMPDVGEGVTLTLRNSPSSVTYHANEPWLVKGDGSEYVLTSSTGFITLKATEENRYARYAATMDRGNFYTTYNNIPAKTAKEGLMYVWDVAKQDFFCSDSVGIQPYRFYVQFYNTQYSNFVKYTQTVWAHSDKKTVSGNRAAQQSLTAAMTDGWQPIFLDPREPQSVTARMLDNYEVAYLADISADMGDENSDSPLTAVSLIYQMVDDRMELPTAIPLLVRAKRADAEPLVNEQMGEEIDEQLLLAALSEDESEDVDTDGFDMPHYWCASLRNRLDIWHLTSPELYADLAEYGCMMFDDSHFDQSFNYASVTDNRLTGPMSYCITVLNTDTYDLLPLMGDRVSVQFIGTESATGIETVQGSTSKVQDTGATYNLNGQRVGASYKGIILQNGRKFIKR